jgi:hypothetical protein
VSKRKQAVPTKRALSKRTAATVPKRARRPKVAARAQRSKQTFVRSPRPLRPDTAASTELPIEVHEAVGQERSSQEKPVFDNRARAVALEAILKAALQDDLSQTVRGDAPKSGFDLLISNVQAYHAKLVEVSQANLQFVFDFTERLAACKSPFELLAVIAEFTGRRIMMIGKHSKELAAYWRVDALRVAPVSMKSATTNS